MCFSLIDSENQQIGFARCITDKSTFAYIDDLFVLEEYRGKGCATYLFSHIINHSELKPVCSWWLLSDSIDVKKIAFKFGFAVPDNVRIGRWLAKPKHKNIDYQK